MRYGLPEFEGDLESFSFSVLVVICRSVSLMNGGGVMGGRRVELRVDWCVGYRSDVGREVGDWGALSIKAGELEICRHGV
jgi:hypothetical protein